MRTSYSICSRAEPPKLLTVFNLDVDLVSLNSTIFFQRKAGITPGAAEMTEIAVSKYSQQQLMLFTERQSLAEPGNRDPMGLRLLNWHRASCCV